MLLSGLQSTLSSEILSRMLRCSDTHQLWNHLFSYFQKKTRARALQLHVERCAIMLDALSIQDYFLKIKTIIDVLTSIGDPLPSSHHINVILEGLSSDYATVVSVIKSKFGSCTLMKLKFFYLLMSSGLQSSRKLQF